MTSEIRGLLEFEHHAEFSEVVEARLKHGYL